MVKIIERGSEKEYQCEGCGKIFYNYGTTNNHEKWECSELGKTQNEREKNRQEDYWICDGCSKEFKTKFETIEHEKNCRQYLEAVKSDTSDGIKSNLLTQWPFDLVDNENVVLAKHSKSSWGSKSVAWWGPMEVGTGDIFVGIFSGGATIPNREGDWHAGSFYLTNQRIIFQGTNKATNLIIDLKDVDSFLFKDLQGNERKVIGEGETHLFVSEVGDVQEAVHQFAFGFPQEAQEVQKQLVSYNQEVTIQKAKHSERVLDYKKAIILWEKIGKHDEAKRIREIVMKGQAQTVVHGDYVDDRDTTIQDSVVSKSNVGAGGKSKIEEIKELKELLDSGAIEDDEFKQMKKEILGK